MPDARGQLLGYCIQFPRALLHLLKCGQGDAVGIEFGADVSVLLKEDGTIREEDKSSLRGNPLTDRSTNLWKTLYNWVVLVKEQKIDPAKTHFVLYANKPVDTNSYVIQLEEAENSVAAEMTLKAIQEQLSDVGLETELGKYLQELFYVSREILKQIIVNFEFECSSSTDDLKTEIFNELRKKYIPEKRLGDIFRSISGWLFYEILSRISQKREPIIYFEEFSRKMLQLVQDVRFEKIVDFSEAQIGNQEEASNAELARRPNYIKQLDLINLPTNGKLKAAIAFLKTNINVQLWIEKDIVSQDEMNSFINHLIEYYNNCSERIQSICAEDTDENKGLKTYMECRERNATINEQTPPAGTIAGTYNQLADEMKLGWHPQWERLLNK